MRFRFASLALVLALAVLSHGQTKPAANAQRPPRPDVFLITIDTLRADHVGCYGYKQVQTPNLDRVAAEGIRFTQAFTVSPITNSSHASILTGDYPSTHGVQDFGSPLAGNKPTWAELLKPEGYHTAAFIGAVILDSKALAPGFDRGFDFYDNFPEKTQGKSRWGRVERRGMEVVESAEKWLGTHRAGPHFVWVHLYDPHDPYEPPPPYNEKYKDRLYDGEIAYADAALGHFLGFLRQQGWYDNALVMIVGDHGEGLGEHHEETHGILLYDATTHVPLLMKPPRGRGGVNFVAPSKVVNAQVRTTDLLPTVLDMLGIKPPASFDGAALQGYLSGAETADRPAIAETDYPLRFGWAPLRAVRDGGFKYVEAPRPELYDLRADPGELQNIYQPAKAAALREQLAKIPRSAEAGQAALPDPKDKIEIQNLIHRADLAIEDGRTAEARAELAKAVRLDPASAPALAELGQVEIQAGDYKAAAEHLSQAVQLRPGDSNALYYLGMARARNAEFAGAAKALEESLKQAPGQFEARKLLGDVYRRAGDLKKAADQLEAAALMRPENSEVRVELGRVLVADKQFGAAVRQLQQAAQMNPGQREAFDLLAQAYRGLGKEAEARKAAAKAARMGSANKGQEE